MDAEPVPQEGCPQTKPAGGPQRRAIEVLAWTLVAFSAVTVVRLYRPMPLINDSYQYLSVAENLRQRHELATSLLYWDTERSHARMPAPLTHYPPGYPALIAVLGFGGGLEAAGRWISCASYAGAAALLAWGLLLAGVAAPWRAWVLLLFTINSVGLTYGTAVLTEPLFMFFATAAAVLLIWAEEEGADRGTALARAGAGLCAAGLAYWVRYAGVFLIVALAVYMLLRFVLPGRRFRVGFLLATAIPMAMAGALMLRNVAIAGTWMGGDDGTAQRALGGVLVEYVQAQWHLLLGAKLITAGLWEAVLLAGCLAAAAFLAAARKDARPEKRAPNTAAMVAGVYVLAYSAEMIYAGSRTMISFGARMFVPTLPLYLLLLAAGASWLTRGRAPGGWAKVGLLLAAVGYAGIHASNLYPGQPAEQQILAAQYAQPAANGRPLREWVESHIQPGEAVVAADGQATGYLLHRPTASLAEADFSRMRWDCETVKEQMRLFQARYVILYKTAITVGGRELIRESPFVGESIRGEPPCGLRVAAENAAVRILEAGPK